MTPVRRSRKAPVWVIRLYIVNSTPSSVRSLANLQRICETQLEGSYRVEVIDLQKHPELAAEDQILAVPTLVRKFPLPVRKIIGDLSATERVLVGLDLRVHEVDPR